MCSIYWMIVNYWGYVGITFNLAGHLVEIPDTLFFRFRQALLLEYRGLMRKYTICENELC